MVDTRLTYLIRIWLPDRPGALGRVATRLGSLRGDVIGLEIIERSGSRAIDELVVSLPSSVSVALIARELAEEDGVEVEDIRLIDGSYDPEIEALEAAAALLATRTIQELDLALCEHVHRSIRSTWVCVISSGGLIQAVAGDAPAAEWIEAFVAASPSANRSCDAAQLDTEWVQLASRGARLVLGRQYGFGSRERQRLVALARISDAWSDRLGG